MAIISINGRAGSGKDTVGKIIQFITHEYEIHGQIYQSYNDFIALKYDQDAFEWKIKKISDKLKDIVSILIGSTREQLEDQTFKDTPLSEEWQGYQISWDCHPNEWEKSFKTEEDAIKYLNDNDAETDIETAYKDKILRKRILTPRIILQSLGTDYGRNMLHPDVWCTSLFTEYKPTNNCQQHSDGLFYTDEHGKNEVVPIYPNWIITDLRFKNEKKRIEDLGGITIRVNRKTGVLPCIGHEFQHLSETDLDNEVFNYTINNNGTIEDLIEVVKEILIREKIIK